jgi:crossover junction endodeoxyribonuclease RusA
MTSQRVRRGKRAGQLVVFHANEDTLMPWRTQLAYALAAAHSGPPMDGPVGVHIVFTMPKPKSAPKHKHTWPAKRPDLDKLMRAVLDAGTEAGVWRDDSQVVMATESKHFVADGHNEVMECPGAYVHIWEVS